MPNMITGEKSMSLKNDFGETESICRRLKFDPSFSLSMHINYKQNKDLNDGSRNLKLLEDQEVYF